MTHGTRSFPLCGAKEKPNYLINGLDDRDMASPAVVPVLLVLRQASVGRGLGAVLDLDEVVLSPETHENVGTPVSDGVKGLDRGPELSEGVHDFVVVAVLLWSLPHVRTIAYFSGLSYNDGMRDYKDIRQNYVPTTIYPPIELRDRIIRLIKEGKLPSMNQAYIMGANLLLREVENAEIPHGKASHDESGSQP